LGIPVSTSQSIVGAVAGLVRGYAQKQMTTEIVGGWMATPLTAGLFSFSIYKLISLLV
jgi:phosphate/sulfate permease